MFDFSAPTFLAELDTARNEYGWSSVGIRIQDEDHPFSVGPIHHTSNVWVDGEDTGAELPGICCLYAATDYIPTLIRHAPDYCWGNYHIAIIVGDVVAYGEDPGEVIMDNTEVIQVIR